MRKSFRTSLIPLAAGMLFSLGATAMTAPDAAAPAMADEMSMSGDMKSHDMSADMKTHDMAMAAKVDLNSADVATLQKELAGIGKAKAEAIIAYRETYGPFTSVDELLEIKGIGAALLERNRDKLMLGMDNTMKQ